MMRRHLAIDANKQSTINQLFTMLSIYAFSFLILLHHVFVFVIGSLKELGFVLLNSACVSLQQRAAKTSSAHFI